METLVYEFPAGRPARNRALAGVVASGDLEVLLEPNDEARTTVSIITSVNGMEPTWRALLERVFETATLPASHIEIHDFGATPGVVRLRLSQVFAELAHDGARGA
jgi:malonate decarboxylase delta subunit